MYQIVALYIFYPICQNSSDELPNDFVPQYYCNGIDGVHDPEEGLQKPKTFTKVCSLSILNVYTCTINPSKRLNAKKHCVGAKLVQCHNELLSSSDFVPLSKI